MINTANSVGVLQGEIAFTTGEAEKPILGSYYTMTCVNLAVYNRSTKNLAFVHFDASSTNKVKATLNLIRTRLETKEFSQCEVYVGSPGIENNSIYKEIQSHLPKNWQIKQKLDSSSMAFDSRRGILIEKVDKEQLSILEITFKERNETRRKLLAKGKSEIQLLFDGIVDTKSNKVTDSYYSYFYSSPKSSRGCWDFFKTLKGKQHSKVEACSTPPRQKKAI